MLVNVLRGVLRTVRRRRSLLLKTVGYRALSVLVTAAVAFLLLRDASAALDVGIWANAVKMGVYYGYERAWSAWEPPDLEGFPA